MSEIIITTTLMELLAGTYSDVDHYSSHQPKVDQAIREAARQGWKPNAGEVIQEGNSNGQWLVTRISLTPNRVILVGRHTSDLPASIEVVRQDNVMWSLDFDECAAQWRALYTEACEQNVRILLQNVPSILAAVLVSERWGQYDLRTGVVIAVPGPRVAALEHSEGFDDAGDQAAAERLIKHANGRAKIEWVGSAKAWLKVTVDPVTPFVFHSIRWF